MVRGWSDHGSRSTVHSLGLEVLPGRNRQTAGIFSWPAFIPITFELGVISAALSALLGMFALNELPRLHHPIFNSKRFERASDDRFFITIEASDPKFSLDATRELLEGLHPQAVETVEDIP